MNIILAALLLFSSMQIVSSYGEGSMEWECQDEDTLNFTGYVQGGEFKIRIDINGEMEWFAAVIDDNRRDFNQHISVSEGDIVEYKMAAVRNDVWKETGGGRAYVEAGGDLELVDGILTVDCKPDPAPVTAQASPPATLPFTGAAETTLGFLAFIFLLAGATLIFLSRKTS